jgi:hypothetical protein
MFTCVKGLRRRGKPNAFRRLTAERIAHTTSTFSSPTNGESCSSFNVHRSWLASIKVL